MLATITYAVLFRVWSLWTLAVIRFPDSTYQAFDALRFWCLTAIHVGLLAAPWNARSRTARSHPSVRAAQRTGVVLAALLLVQLEAVAILGHPVVPVG